MIKIVVACEQVEGNQFGRQTRLICGTQPMHLSYPGDSDNTNYIICFTINHVSYMCTVQIFEGDSYPPSQLWNVVSGENKFLPKFCCRNGLDFSQMVLDEISRRLDAGHTLPITLNFKCQDEVITLVS